MANSTSNSSALECADGVTSSGGVCGTDTADVNVSIEGGWAISVSSAGILEVDVSPTNSGVLSTVVDNVNVYTNIPTGYQLYLNSTSGSTNIYNTSDTEQSQNHFVETSGTKATPAELAGDTWGYSLEATPTAFAKVALTSDDADSNIYTANTKTPSEGDDIPVTYGFMADTKLQPGTYSTQVTYTAIADAPTYTITSISPSTLQQNDQTNKTITIMTSTPASELAFGEVSAKIGTVDLTDCSEITSDGFRGATCTYSGSLTPGYYNVELISTWHNATYAKANAFVVMSYLTVSGGSGSGWYAPDTVVDIVAEACDTSYRFNNWTTTGGALGDANSSSTTITTISDNITVTRNCIINPYLTVSGGTGSGYYAPGSTVTITADACGTGYAFNKWTTTGGTLAADYSRSTTIKIASSNVTVTRKCSYTSCSKGTIGEIGWIDGYQTVKLADGKCWQTSNYKTDVRWDNRGSCPTGFTFPSKSDFDTLVGKYSDGGLYSAWHLSTGEVFWSSTEASDTAAYRLLVSRSSANVTAIGKGAFVPVRCYTTN